MKMMPGRDDHEINRRVGEHCLDAGSQHFDLVRAGEVSTL